MRINLIIPTEKIECDRLLLYIDQKTKSSELLKQKINSKELSNITFEIEGLKDIEIKQFEVENILGSQKHQKSIKYIFYFEDLKLKITCNVENLRLNIIKWEEIKDKPQHPYLIEKTKCYVEDSDPTNRISNYMNHFLVRTIENDIKYRYFQQLKNKQTRIKRVTNSFIRLLKSHSKILKEWCDGGVVYEKSLSNKKKIYTSHPISPIYDVISTDEKSTTLMIYPEDKADFKSEVEDFKATLIVFKKPIEKWPDRAHLKIPAKLKSIIDEKNHLINTEIKLLDQVSNSYETVKLLNTLFFDKNPIKTKGKDNLTIETQNINLDKDQIEFLKMAFCTPDYAICTGDPGSGKTTILSILVTELSKRGYKSLVISQTNNSVDEILLRTVKRDSDLYPLRLIGKDSKQDPEIQKYCIENPSNAFLNAIIQRLKNHLTTCKNNNPFTILQKKWLNSLNNKKDIFPDWYLSCFNAIFATADIAKGIPYYDLKNVVLPELFDYLIIDTAETISVKDILIIVKLASKLVLAGDTNQKRPTQEELFVNNVLKRITNKKNRPGYEKIRDWYIRTIVNPENINYTRNFEKIQNDFKEIERIVSRSHIQPLNVLTSIMSRKKNTDRIIKLRGNYRNKHIMQLLNSKSDYEVIKLSATQKNLIKFFNTHKISEVLRCKQGSTNIKSKKNNGEAKAICKIFKEEIIEQEYHKRNNIKEIAIVSPYKAQVDEALTQEFNKLPHLTKLGGDSKTVAKFEIDNESNLLIETINGFSNGECDLLILSFTIQNKRDLTKFLLNEEMFYNALSRARKEIWIIGNIDVIEEILERKKVRKQRSVLQNVNTYIKNVGIYKELDENYLNGRDIYVIK